MAGFPLDTPLYDVTLLSDLISILPGTLVLHFGTLARWILNRKMRAHLSPVYKIFYLHGIRKQSDSRPLSKGDSYYASSITWTGFIKSASERYDWVFSRERTQTRRLRSWVLRLDHINGAIQVNISNVTPLFHTNLSIHFSLQELSCFPHTWKDHGRIFRKTECWDLAVRPTSWIFSGSSSCYRKKTTSPHLLNCIRWVFPLICTDMRFLYFSRLEFSQVLLSLWLPQSGFRPSRDLATG